MFGFNVTLLSTGPTYGPTIVPIVGYLGPSAKKTFDSPKKLTVPWQKIHDNETNPSFFLSWHSETTEFCGRDRELDALNQWALNDQAISIKFVTGEEGVGKSRLAAEFARSMQNEHQWSAGFIVLRKPTPFVFEGNGLLFVVDYPEEQREGLEELLRDLAELDHNEWIKAKKKLRVLFLSRQLQTEWMELLERTKSAILRDPVSMNLGGIDSEAGHKVFNSALENSSEKTAPDQIIPPASVDDIAAWMKQQNINSRPLFIAAAAVYNALHPQELAIRFNGAEIMKALARREKVRLDNSCQEKICKNNQAFSYLIAAACIAGVLTLSDLKSLLQTTVFKHLFKKDEDVIQALKQSKLLVANEIRAIHPDLLAAAFVVETLKEATIDLSEFLWQALIINPDLGITRLGRLAYNAEFTLDLKDIRLVDPLLAALKDQPEKCLRLENSVAHQLPHTILKVGIAVYECLLQNQTNKAESAARLHNLSNFYSDIGKRNEALDVALRAVAIREKLAQNKTEAFEPDLAMSLNSLGNRYSESGKWNKALDAVLRAVAIYEKLAHDKPEAFEPLLATGLVNLGNIYSALGELNKALNATLKAVEIYQKLSNKQPEAFGSLLAIGLVNLGNKYSVLGELNKALKAALKAVDIYQKLAFYQPETFEPKLASSLNNLGVFYSKLNKRIEALEATLQAVVIREKLACNLPDAFEPYLATSYCAIGSIYGNFDDMGKAKEYFHKGISTLKRLFLLNPRAFASSMNDLLKDYIEICNRTNTPPDEALIKPIVEKFQELTKTEES